MVRIGGDRKGSHGKRRAVVGIHRNHGVQELRGFHIADAFRCQRMPIA